MQAVGAAASAAGVRARARDGMPRVPAELRRPALRHAAHLRAVAHWSSSPRPREHPRDPDAGRARRRALVGAVSVAALHAEPGLGRLRCELRARCRPGSAPRHRRGRPRAGRRPRPPKPRTGAPLVLALPGAGQTARDFAAYTGYSRARRPRAASRSPTRRPSGSRPFWNISGDSAGQARRRRLPARVIRAVVKAACADPARVGVTGVSNGGGMSARMACDAADLIAAAAPVAGGYGSLPDCRPSRPVPILEIHGTSTRSSPTAAREPGPAGDVPRSSRSGAARRLHRRAAARAAPAATSSSCAGRTARAGRRSSTTASAKPTTAGRGRTTSAAATSSPRRGGRSTS